MSCEYEVAYDFPEYCEEENSEYPEKCKGVKHYCNNTEDPRTNEEIKLPFYQNTVFKLDEEDEGIIQTMKTHSCYNAETLSKWYETAIKEKQTLMCDRGVGRGLWVARCGAL